MDTFARRTLIESGTTDHEIRAFIAGKKLERIRQGRYARPKEWREAYVEERQRALAHSATEAAVEPPTVCRVTAAALHGLPLFRIRDDAAHLMTGDTGSGTRSGSVRRHRDRWDGETEEIDGVRATTLVRTVFDVARTTPLATGLACADAAIHRVAATGRTHETDEEKADRFRDELRGLVGLYRGARGVTNARFVTEFMDPRADSPGESVSRLFLAQSGYGDVALQIPVTGRAGRRYFVDFDIEGTLGEFDGAVKYLNAETRGGRTIEEVVMDENRREDDIRAATGLRLIRWTNTEIRSRATFVRFLRENGIHPRERTRFVPTNTKQRIRSPRPYSFGGVRRGVSFFCHSPVQQIGRKPTRSLTSSM
jgi:hypothetical protein